MKKPEVLMKQTDDLINAIWHEKLLTNGLKHECVKRLQEVQLFLQDGELPIINERIGWKQMFIEIAKIVAKRSKDPHTKVGAVLVKNNCIIGTGYNGDPRNFNYKFNWNSLEKYDYVIHAEMNALANACYNGCEVKDSEIYLTLSPCNHCILQLIQFGVKKVYYLKEYIDFELSKKIAENGGIELIKLEEE